jgi:hypothetical protein
MPDDGIIPSPRDQFSPTSYRSTDFSSSQCSAAIVKETLQQTDNRWYPYRALSPLSQLSHTKASATNEDDHVSRVDFPFTLQTDPDHHLCTAAQTYSRVQVRCINETDAKKIVDTLLEFCPQLDGGQTKDKQRQLTQSSIRSTRDEEESLGSGMLTESQMGGTLDVARSEYGSTMSEYGAVCRCLS